MVQEIGYGMIYFVIGSNGMLFCATVRVSGCGDSVVNADAGNRV